MVTIKIDENALLNLFMDRLETWVEDKDVLDLYEGYLSELINCSCFEGAELDVMQIIDNLYINDTQVMDNEELKQNEIDVDDCDNRVLAKNEEKDLYLVSNY